MCPANPFSPSLGCTPTEDNGDYGATLREIPSPKTHTLRSPSSLSSSLPSPPLPSLSSPPCSLDAVTGLGEATQQHEAFTRHLVHDFFTVLGQDLARFEREVHYLANQIKYPPPSSTSTSTYCIPSSSPSSSSSSLPSSSSSPSSCSSSSLPSSSSFSSSSPPSSSSFSSSSPPSSSAAPASVSASRPFGSRLVVALQLLEHSAFQRKQADAHGSLSLDELVDAVRNLLWVNGEKLKRLGGAGDTGEEREREVKHADERLG